MQLKSSDKDARFTEAFLNFVTLSCFTNFETKWQRVMKWRNELLQTGDMKRRPGKGIEGAMVCTSLGSLLRPLFYFLDDVSYPQSVVKSREEWEWMMTMDGGSHW